MSTLFIHGSADLYGSAKILLQIVKVCVREKKKALVILPHKGSLVKELEELGVEVFVINIGVLRRRYFTPWGIIGRVFLWVFSSYKIVQLIKKYNVSKIYISSLTVFIGPFLKWLTGRQLIMHLHEIVERPVILKFFLIKFLEKADQVIAVSAATKSFWMRQSKKIQIHLLYNGIPTENFWKSSNLSHSDFPFTLKITDNAVLIAMIGRIQPWKGQMYFLDILKFLYKDINAEKHKVFAVIIGDAYPGYEYHEEELKRAIEQYDLSDNVFYLGYRKDIPEVLASIDLLVLPSISLDPLPTVVLEAMAASKPVLATFQGGAVEMIKDNITGVFIPVGDARKAADILKNLVFDEGKMKVLGINGFNRVNEYFSLEAFEKNWLKLFLTF